MGGGDGETGGRKRSDMDTEKSMEELSEDDLSFLPPGHPDDSGAHEGGR